MKRTAFKKLMMFASVTLVTLAASTKAQAYEPDTHFYATYAMARYAGIKHDVASVIASSAQWPDETEILGSPFLPDVIGTKMRRLFHFSCLTKTQKKFAASATTAAGDFGAKLQKFGGEAAAFIGDNDAIKEYLDTLNVLCKTLPGDEIPISYNGLFEGLQAGDLIKAATSIHTIEDSFAHAGTLDTAGHAYLGHTPDRPNSSPEKYRRMISAVMRAMVAIRMNLPESAIDKDYHDSKSKVTLANYQMNSEQLATNYMDNQYVQKDYRVNYFKDPEFVKAAIAYMLTIGQKVDDDGSYFISPNFDVISWFNSQSDLVAEINKGQSAQCSLDSVQAPHVPTFINCILVKAVTRLMVTKDNLGYLVADGFSVGGENMDNGPWLNGIVKPYDDAIKNLLTRRSQLALPSKYSRSFDTQSRKVFDQILAINQEISRLRDLRRRKIAEPYNFQLAREASYGIDSRPMLLALVESMTAGFLPAIPDEENKAEFEYEGQLRQYELALRIRGMRQTIHELFGDYVRFVENEKDWSYPSVRPRVQNLPLRQPDLLPLPGEYERTLSTDGLYYLTTNIRYITFNYNQIDTWVENSIRYMFPDFTNFMFPADKCGIVSAQHREINGKIVTLKPALNVTGKGDVFGEFANALFSPVRTGCGTEWDKNGIPRFGYKVSQAKVLRFLEDFRTSHVKVDHRLVFFKSANDLALQKLFQQKRPDGTPLFRQFKTWGQLDQQQSYDIKHNLQHRFELLNAGRADDSPYSSGNPFKDTSH